MTTVGIFEAKNRLSDTADADVNAALNIRDRARGCGAMRTKLKSPTAWTCCSRSRPSPSAALRRRVPKRQEAPRRPVRSVEDSSMLKAGNGPRRRGRHI